jgi:predicted phosphodiesterase
MVSLRDRAGQIIQHVWRQTDNGYTMQDRIVIISDTHMGRPDALVRSPEMLRPLWQGASGLIVNGDVAEVHDPRYRIEAANQVLGLHDLCERDGADLTLLSGNHDPYISDTRHLSLADGSVFVTHGDALHPAIAPWCPSAPRVRQAHDRAMASLHPEDRGTLKARLSVTQHSAHKHWEAFEKAIQQSAMRQLLARPWMVLEVLWYWRSVPGLAKRFAQEHAPGARFFIFGHTHRQGIWRRDGVTLINTGSFGFPGRPRAVVIEAGRLSVYRIKKHSDVFRFDDAPLSQFDLSVLPT